MGVLWKQYVGGLQAQYLLCSYKDGVKTSYENKRHNGNCDLTSSIRDDANSQNRIVIFPNPTQDFVSIDNKGGVVFDEFQIVSRLGEIRRFSGATNLIDLTEYPPGFYTLQLISHSGTMYSYSIIKL